MLQVSCPGKHDQFLTLEDLTLWVRIQYFSSACQQIKGEGSRSVNLEPAQRELPPTSPDTTVKDQCHCPRFCVCERRSLPRSREHLGRMRTSSSPLTNLWPISSLVYPRESCGPTSVFSRGRGFDHSIAVKNKAKDSYAAVDGLQTPLSRAVGGVTGGVLEGRAVGTGRGPALECVCCRDGRREEAEAGCSVAEEHVWKQSESGEHGVGREPRVHRT